MDDAVVKNRCSVVFLSFHKCATSYFSSYVLNHMTGLKQVDYLQSLYLGHAVQPDIDASGFVYGVIRLQDADHPRYTFVNDFLARKAFNGLRQIYWTRDPRDILVSAYYSFAFTHGFSKEKLFLDYQMKTRLKYQSMTLDACVLSEAEALKVKFLQMQRLMEASESYIHLKYEDMILNFDAMFDRMDAYVTLDDEVRERFFKDTRANASENLDSHRRSGVVGGYESKLKPETIAQLNVQLKDVLESFGYE